MALTAIRTGTICLLLAGAAPAPACAADVMGKWLTEEGKATVAISDCGGALCGTIVALKEPNDPDTGQPLTDKRNADPSKRDRPLIGVQVMLGMKPAGTDLWKGPVYNAEDGKTYSGSLMIQDGNTLKLQGCILGGVICKATLWTRAG